MQTLEGETPSHSLLRPQQHSALDPELVLANRLNPSLVRLIGQRKLRESLPCGKAMETFRREALGGNHRTDKQGRENVFQVQVEWKRKTIET